MSRDEFGCVFQVPQHGVDSVDLLLAIDNSGSMSEEQRKLATVLPSLVSALATGNKDGRPRPAGMKSDFPPVQSLHMGVVTSDMGINGAPVINSCGALSFVPSERDTRTSTQRINKPVGDDGVLQVSTEVAVAGIYAPPTPDAPVEEKVAPDPSCASVSFPNNQRFVEFAVGGDANAAATRFGCIAKRGRNGCGLEQQLEAVLKALTPPDSAVKFTGPSPNGHGAGKTASGFNQGFLREDSILAIVVVSDEEDCSSPDSSRAIFDGSATQVNGAINVRCGLRENQGLLHPISRYIGGLTALKPPGYKDRLIFAGAVGIPLASNTGAKVHSGAATLDKILARPDMQFAVRRNMAGSDDEPVPTCVGESGDGSAAPGRRYLELTKAFGDNGVITSICEDEYQSLFDVLIEKIADQLTGACLSRPLNSERLNKKGACELVEVQAARSEQKCDPRTGRIKELPGRFFDGSVRRVCLIEQVDPKDDKQGWYYDDSSEDVATLCPRNPQRIVLTDGAAPSPGSQLRLECPIRSGVCDG